MDFMMKTFFKTCRLLLVMVSITVSGCATTSTLGQPDQYTRSLIMSGTRLNIASLTNQPFINERFGVAPPSFPILDLPFSAFLDVLVLGYTLPVTLVNQK